MEQVLDDIAVGKSEWLPYMSKFFREKDGLENRVIAKTEEIPPGEFRSIHFDELDAKILIGKFGPYFEIKVDEESITASIPQNITPADFNQEVVDDILIKKSKGTDELGVHPETGKPVYLLNGTYGPYVQHGKVEKDQPKPKRVTLPKGMEESEVDFDTAVILLSLPRLVGKHPETDGPITAGISRFGSYICYEEPSGDKDFRSLVAEDSVITVTVERALELLSVEKKSRRRKSEPIRTVGEHPKDGQSVEIFKGPYGPYIKYAAINASIPKEMDLDTLSLEQAIELLDARIKNKSPRRATKRRK